MYLGAYLNNNLERERMILEELDGSFEYPKHMFWL